MAPTALIWLYHIASGGQERRTAYDLKPFVVVQRVRHPPGKGQPAGRLARHLLPAARIIHRYT
jgi:hypothetical protein